MAAIPFTVARQLWRTAPQWRFTVTAACFLTIGSILYGSLGGGGERPAAPGYDPTMARPRSGPVPPDPASDARLASYENAHDEALKITNAAQRCEKLAAVFTALEDRDKARARHPSAPRSRAIAVTDGERCARDIAASNSRWRALDQAAADAGRAQTGAAVARVVELSRSLNDFDRGRSRTAAQATLLTRVATLTKDFESSEKRVADATAAAAALNKENTPANVASAAQAWQTLTDFDRNRLTPDEQAAVAPARDAAAKVALSRGKLRRLEQAVAAVQDGNPPPQARRQFIDALAAVNETDRLIATEQQKATIQTAEQRAGALGWSVLEEASSDLKQDMTPANSEKLANLWTLLRDRLPSASTPSQNESAQAARGAVAALASSDERLAALMRADEVWSKNHSDAQGQRLVAASLHEITDFDQKRFSDPQRRAWENLNIADMIIRGPDLKAPLPKARLPILVTAAAQSPMDSRIANDIKKALKDAGFLVAANESESAIAMEIATEQVTDPKPDYSGSIVSFRVDATVSVRAVWTVDSSGFLNTKATGFARSSNSDRGVLQADAMRAAIADLVRRTESRMQTGS